MKSHYYSDIVRNDICNELCELHKSMWSETLDWKNSIEDNRKLQDFLDGIILYVEFGDILKKEEISRNRNMGKIQDCIRPSSSL